MTGETQPCTLRRDRLSFTLPAAPPLPRNDTSGGFQGASPGAFDESGADLTRRLAAHRARSRTPQDGELVFTELGRPLIPNSQPRRAFQRAVRDAGIHEPFPKLHDLRHAYASALLAAGLTVHAVAQLLGHSSPQLVMARYGHAYRTEVLSAADRLDALMAERGSRAA